MNDVPLEGLLKYIKQERDEYKEKLDKIVPYTKGLEHKAKALDIRIIELNTRVKELTDQLTEYKRKLQNLHNVMQKDVSQSDVYKQLNEKYMLLRKEYKDLQITVGKLHMKLAEKDDKGTSSSGN